MICIKLREVIYDREAAVKYAERWAMSRNPEYYSFNDIGGDCTNFASQCLYAGCGVMNYTPVMGWFYINSWDRTASWTGVEYLYNFLTTNNGVGPHAVEVKKSELEPGDLVQLGRADGSFYHTPVVLGIKRGMVYVAAHSDDSLWRPLSSYNYEAIRFLHIDKVLAES